MKRRDFITLLGGAAVWPLAARAQQAIPVIGYLGAGGPFNPNSAGVQAFRQGLAEIGYVEGRNVTIEYRWAGDQTDRLPALAADLVQRRVAAIFVIGVPAILAAKAATTTIPIVFQTAADPITAGIVASMTRPGGNLTGVANLNVELAPKRLELLHEAVPGAKEFALLVNPANPNAEAISKGLQTATQMLGLGLHILSASAERDFDAVSETLAQLRSGGLVIGTDGVFNSRAEQLAALALRRAVPAISQYHAFAAAGGLMSYGGNAVDAPRLAGVYAGRILKGEKPADMPVQQATRIELAINLKTAKALGMTFPITLLGRADEVIE
jgi:putative ABC transport system substrate-binding protein